MIPERASVVVIGGGIVGVCTVLNLARWGHDVVLVEKGEIAAEQSSRNWGWIRIQNRSPAEVPLMLQSRSEWLSLVTELDSDIGFRQTGCTFVARTDDELARGLTFLPTARAHGLDTRQMSAADLHDVLGPIRGPVHGGLYTASDYAAEPSLAVPALARLARQYGARIFEGVAARSLERRGGKLSAVITEHGRIVCDEVVLAGGVWSRPFLENQRLRLPQLGVISTAQRTSQVDLPFSSTVGTSAVSIRPRLDGGATLGRVSTGRFELVPAAFRYGHKFMAALRDPQRRISVRLGWSFFGPLGYERWGHDYISPMERERIMNPSADARLNGDILASAKAMFGGFAAAASAEQWAGMIDVMPDEIPVIDRIDAIPGLTLATGFSGHGFGLGPGAGRLVAEIVAGRPLTVPNQAFRYGRFY